MSGFYERNPGLKRPLENARSSSELLDHRSREELLRQTFWAMREWRKYRGVCLWTWIGHVTGHGSGYSEQICIELGWDPDMKIGPNARLPDRTRRNDQERS